MRRQMNRCKSISRRGLFFEQLDKVAYRVTLNERGKLQWEGIVNGAKVIKTTEPSTSRRRRFKAWLRHLVSGAGFF